MKNATVSVLDAHPNLNATSLYKVTLKRAFVEFEKLMNSRGYFDFVLGKIEFHDHLIEFPKYTEPIPCCVYTVGTFKISLKIQWDRLPMCDKNGTCIESNITHSEGSRERIQKCT